ncbi:MAG: serine/threonine protein kinase, partial [Myxococcales bacterium]|nr:serine/threonine protein kinase [Myxococcales bacterium]
MNETIRLGQFALDRPIGEGGMGQVWSARHERDQVPVAVKFINSLRARDRAMREAFRREVRAVAGLNHPGIVMVFDYGEVPKAVEDLSSGHLRQGTPYLVMEELTGGPLDAANQPGDWLTLQQILTELLKALAHAHARGVIHRDLKLNNVVMGAETDARPGLKIIDFGLAQMQEGDRETSRSLRAGAPAFEAPEKILGDYRSQGPWTDLYSLGCMAFALASGQPPYISDDIQQLVRCQLMVPMPALTPVFPIPSGFEAWLRRMLAKHPNDRYRTAADALHGLQTLASDPFVGPPDGLSVAARHEPTTEVMAAAQATAVTRPLDLVQLAASS